jgi:spermidine dehydrogenase
MTLEELLMERDGMSRETIRTFLSAVEAGSFGLGADAVSAFIAYAGRVQYPRDGDPQSGGQMPLGGNTAIARMTVKTLIPSAIHGEHTLDAVSRNSVNFAALDRRGSQTRIRLNSTVVWVRHEGDSASAPFVKVAYVRDGKFHSLKARAVVLAGGSWTTRRIVRDLPAEHRDAYSQFHRAPCLMASVAMRHWRFLHKMGVTGGRWFEGIGEYTEVRKQALFTGVPKTVGPDSPTILTVKAIYSYPGEPIAAQTTRGRAELYSVPFREYERRIREHFTDMFSQAGFDPRRDIAGIILNRWGHAYLAPQPGFFFGTDGKPAPHEVLRRAPFGRMSFANTDLRGNNDNRHSIVEAHRAVNQILDRIV